MTAVEEEGGGPVGAPQGPDAAQRQRAGQGEPVQRLEHRRGDKGGGLEVLEAGHVEIRRLDQAGAGRQLVERRLVAKSLPSVPLIREVMAQTGTDRVMVFHQPFINAMAEAEPGCDLLLGQPMPGQAAARF